jgi:alkanesulfonate monooxygenase SsuD/methylene tetrahydromethanopterin reductase-like flavin-dependent oxidoreductase (luciferase family)
VEFERRGRYADEFIDVMKLLWTTGRSSFHGEFFAFDDVEAYPGPYRPGGLPLLVGGHGPAAIRRLVARGDGWHGIGLEPPAADAQRREVLLQLAGAGREFTDLPFQVRLHIDADDLDEGAWRSKARAYAEAGITDLVLAPQTRSKDSHRRWLETLMPILTSAG